MTFANLTELILLGLAPENYSALQSIEPKKCFYSPESEQKPSTTSVLRFQDTFLQPCQSPSLES